MHLAQHRVEVHHVARKNTAFTPWKIRRHLQNTEDLIEQLRIGTPIRRPLRADAALPDGAKIAKSIAKPDERQPMTADIIDRVQIRRRRDDRIDGLRINAGRTRITV